jgi:hypothetical protein
MITGGAHIGCISYLAISKRICAQYSANLAILCATDKGMEEYLYKAKDATLVAPVTDDRHHRKRVIWQPHEA